MILHIRSRSARAYHVAPVGRDNRGPSATVPRGTVPTSDSDLSGDGDERSPGPNVHTNQGLRRLDTYG